MSTSDVVQQEPDWDMTTYFSQIGAPDYLRYLTALDADIEALKNRIAETAPLAEDSYADWAALFASLEDISNRNTHVSSYYSCMGSADAKNDEVKRDTALHAARGARVDGLFVSARAALGKSSDGVFDKLIATDELKPVSHFVGRLRQEAKRSMSEEQESLSSELAVDGIGAWGRLYDQITGGLQFELKVADKEPQRLPVSMTRTLLEDPDPEVRSAAMQGSAKAWHSVSESIAASLNAIAGTRLTLYKRRGIKDFREPALFDAGITRETLDCMMSVVRSRQDLPQSYLKKKAELLGMDKLRFCDLQAPLATGSEERVSWEQGCGIVQKAFDDSYKSLGDLARLAFRERWIDHSPRDGKRPGGFCSPSQVTGQSRIFMTFNGAMGDVQTLAHELGHTFHSYLMRELRPWAAEYPMTLAETASTFAENLVTNAALSNPDTTSEKRRQILDQRLQDSAAFMLNIPMRFDFESNFYEKRKSGELSVDELQNMMRESQRKNYGESLDPEHLDPWFWASKLHFYITEISFYNFPYTFGYLFSMGIFARYLELGTDFLPRYEKLLMQTGSAPAEQVAKDSLDVDLQKPDFWNASIDLIEKDWQAFQELL
jgi:oligoendopeptidase F